MIFSSIKGMARRAAGLFAPFVAAKGIAAVVGSPVVGPALGAAAGGAAAYFGTKAVAPAIVRYAKGLGRGFSRAYGETAAALKNGVSNTNKLGIFGYLDEAVSAGAPMSTQLGAYTGSVAGMSARLGLEVQKTGAKAIGRGASWTARHSPQIATAGAMAFSGLAMSYMMNAGGGNPLSPQTYGMRNAGVRSEDYGYQLSQQQAIVDERTYQTSSLAGMGGPMRFGGRSYMGPLPILPAMQRAAGYRASNMGAGGDLMFALNSLRR